MSQNDFVIANQTAPAFRSDLNDALQALASMSSGATAPSTTYANMLWYDTANNILKVRAEADDVWINLLYLDQSNDLMHILENTEVSDSSGTKVGNLGVQSQATWEAGTGTEETLVSPEKIKAAIDALTTGGLVPISTATLANDAQVDFTLDVTTYNSFLLEFVSVVPSSDGRDIYVRLSNDGGTTFRSGGSDYKWTTAPTSYIQMMNQSAGSAANEFGVWGLMYVVGAADASRRTAVKFDHILQNTSGHIQTGNAGGILESAAEQNDAIRIFYSAGNLESGTITLYGVVGP